MDFFKRLYTTFNLNKKLCEEHELFATPKAYQTDRTQALDSFSSGIPQKLYRLNFSDNIFDHYYMKRVEKKNNIIQFRNGTPSALFKGNYPANIKTRSPDHPAYKKGHDYLLNLWGKLQKIIPSSLLDRCGDNGYGDPIFFEVHNKLITEFITRHIYYFSQIHRFPSQHDDSIRLEIGGGYGGLAKLFVETIPSICYVIIDLPLSLILEEYFLTQTFPEKKIATSQTFYSHFLSQKKITKNDLKLYDIVLLSQPFVLLLEDNIASTAINTHSLMEMNPDQFFFYYDNIYRLLDGYFYQCNRIRHKCYDFSFDDWPLERWETVYKDIQFNYPGILEIVLKPKK